MADEMEFQVPELCGYYGWRTRWFTSGELPTKEVYADTGKDVPRHRQDNLPTKTVPVIPEDVDLQAISATVNAALRQARA